MLDSKQFITGATHLLTSPRTLKNLGFSFFCQQRINLSKVLKVQAKSEVQTETKMLKNKVKHFSNY